MDNRTKRRQMSMAYRSSFTRLGLNYYTMYEAVYDEHSASQKVNQILEEFNRILEAFLKGEGEISPLDTLRNRLIHDMNILTAYTDCFQIYEYVLNRVERRFVKGKPIPWSVDEFTGRIMEVLAQSEDAGVRNSRIQEILGQLPIRYTKQKFFSMVMERLTVYAGAGKKSLKDVLYMLGTSAMISLPEDMEAEWPGLYKCLEKLRHMDYKNLDKEHYWEAMESIHEASQWINQESGLYLLAADLVNDLYVLFLTRDQAVGDSEEKQLFFSLAQELSSAFERKDGQALPEKCQEYLEKLEGIQEYVMEQFMPDEGENDPVLSKIVKLTSGSSFASLEGHPGEEEPADRQWIEEKGDAFCQELAKKFEGMPKPVVRAVMAKILSYLPVVFRSYEEVEDYMRTSLEGCTDFAEREACMELLSWEFMDECALV